MGGGEARGSPSGLGHTGEPIGGRTGIPMPMPTPTPMPTHRSSANPPSSCRSSRPHHRPPGITATSRRATTPMSRRVQAAGERSRRRLHRWPKTTASPMERPRDIRWRSAGRGTHHRRGDRHQGGLWAFMRAGHGSQSWSAGDAIREPSSMREVSQLHHRHAWRCRLGRRNTPGVSP
jgi:hypothetical protein